MSRHQADLVACLKQPGTNVGLLCEKCDGQCPTCGSFVRPTRKVKICDDCSFGNFQGKCILCGSGKGSNEAYYCYECVCVEKDRDGCPKIINVGSARRDHFFDNKKKLRN